MNESTDTPQIAYLRDLEAKRNAAFALENPTDYQRQIIAAYTQVTGLKWTAPIRTNEPLAGDPAYERCSPAPHMTRTGWLIAAGCCLGGAFFWWWLLSWAVGVIGGGR